ncbi:Uncharacterized protein Rs2_36199 [Raphanus sativus]|nr:Uncharacterized protein Rs2_51444 [Raphanus sativus]KAJ4879145.1 Uncharacterized protein Rs2_36199 [Raphanus sativus]
MVLHFGVLRSQKVILMNHLCSAGLSAVSQEKKELSSSVTAPISIAISPPSSSIMDVLLCILRKIKFKKTLSNKHNSLSLSLELIPSPSAKKYHIVSVFTAEKLSSSPPP